MPLFGRLGLADQTHLANCACGDQVNQVWFLALAHSSITTGHLSFFTTRIDYPTGINVLDNASLPLLGALMTPVTSIIGPVGSFALLVRVAFVLSATAAFLVVRRVVSSDLAAAAGGALYGFSPYMTHQGANHMFLAFVPLPPVMLLLIYRHVTSTRAHRALTGGVLLGCLAVLQYFISSEILVSTGLIAVLTGSVLGARELLARRPVGPHVRAAVRMAAGAAAVAVPLLAYPAWDALAGPAHVSGPTQLVTSPGIGVLSTLLPTDRQLLAGLWPGWKVAPLAYLGDTAFVGVPLLLVCAYVAVTRRHSAVVRTSTTLAVVAWVLALGPRLVIGTHVTHLPLPFSLVTHVPVLQDLIPSRLTLFVDLAVAVLVAIAVDRAWSQARHRPARAGLGLAATAASVAFALPWVSFPAEAIGAARGFAGGAVERAIPAGAVVLAYPYPIFPEDDAMLWQAESGMRFSLLGGYAVRPSAAGAVKTPALLAPPAAEEYLLESWPDLQLTGAARTAPPPGARPATAPRTATAARPATSAATRTSAQAAAQALPALVHRYHVSVVLVEDRGGDPGRVVALFRRLYGPPRRFGPIDLWATPG